MFSKISCLTLAICESLPKKVCKLLDSWKLCHTVVTSNTMWINIANIIIISLFAQLSKNKFNSFVSICICIYYIYIHRCIFNVFFISNTFISNARLKKAKNQANSKQHPRVELLLYKDYSHSSSTLSSKNNMTYSKK